MPPNYGSLEFWSGNIAVWEPERHFSQYKAW